MGFFSKKSCYWQQKLGTFTPKTAPSLADAFQLFDHLAGLPHIAFDYIGSACESRTHLMALELIRRGHLPAKAWLFENDSPLICQKPGDDPALNYFWCYHVAPVLNVDAGPAQGGVIPMVFDPGLFDGPVPVGAWADAMKRRGRDVVVSPLGHSPQGYTGDFMPGGPLRRGALDTISFTNARTDDYAARRMKEIRQELGDAKQRVVLSCGLREPRYTPLWRTEGAVAHLPRQAPAAQMRRL
jgi:hypothetical protein